jgi:hypothetical protein
MRTTTLARDMTTIPTLHNIYDIINKTHMQLSLPLPLPHTHTHHPHTFAYTYMLMYNKNTYYIQYNLQQFDVDCGNYKI